MAIITEEEAEDHTKDPKPTNTSPMEPASRPQKKPSAEPQPSRTNANPFVFWFYFTLAASLVTLFFVSLPPLSAQDPKSWFLSLPAELRQHYSKGRTIKVQLEPSSSAIEVFSIEKGPALAQTVLIVHGYGASSYTFRRVVEYLGARDLHAIAIDLPGHGFSDKSVAVEEEVDNGVWERLRNAYDEIKEKGVFYAFDQIIETGQMPYQEIEIPRVVNRKRVKVIELGSGEVGKVLGQVIESRGLAPVHLVLHDLAFAMSANWILNNVRLVSSITLVDASAKPALPLWAFKVPVVRDVLLGFPFLHNWLLGSYCVKGISSVNANAHRILLNGRDGKRAVAEMGKRLNQSFDVAEWGSLEGLTSMPMYVLWSKAWSKEWSEEGRQTAKSLPQAKFVEHSGGRWPQEDAADELAEIILRHVSSLPKSERKHEEEPLPEHIKRMFDEAKAEGGHLHHHHHNHHGHDHGHAHMAGYPDAYGMGHGWGS